MSESRVRKNRMHGLKRRGLETEPEQPRQSPTLLRHLEPDTHQYGPPDSLCPTQVTRRSSGNETRTGQDRWHQHGRRWVGASHPVGLVSKSTYAKVWREARNKAFGEKLAATPLAKRPYDLRHACVSTWLNAGVPATQVAEWAGHSVDVLLRIYAKCLDGTQDAARRRIAEALGDTAEPGEVRSDAAAPYEGHEPEDNALASEDIAEAN